MISYDDFAKLDLRVGTVQTAEPIKGSEKLLKLDELVCLTAARSVPAGTKIH